MTPRRVYLLRVSLHDSPNIVELPLEVSTFPDIWFRKFIIRYCSQPPRCSSGGGVGGGVGGIVADCVTALYSMLTHHQTVSYLLITYFYLTLW